jgi:dTDP-4-dehydrorhamnose 3,5-epimerase
MEIIITEIDGLLIIKPKVFADPRGYFYESFNEKKYSEAGIILRFVQDNQSKSVFGVVRGLHYQIEPYAQTKLIRVLSGKIRDIAVDLRKGSPTFGKSYSIDLSCENKLQLLVPKGFAHGFSVLSETAVVLYKTDNFYNPSAERGICFNDQSLSVDWGLKPSEIIVTERDKSFPGIDRAEMNFIFKKP